MYQQFEPKFGNGYNQPRRTFLLSEKAALGSKIVSGSGPIKKGWQDKTEEPKRKAFYNRFLETTSIPGFSQLGRQDTGYGKLFWLFLFFACVGLAVYQSWGLLQDYYKYITYQQSVLLMNATLPLPAITICNKNPIRWAHIGPNHPVQVNALRGYKVLQEEMENFGVEVTKIVRRVFYESALLQAMRNYTFENPDDVEMYFSLKDIVAVTFWNMAQTGSPDEEFITFHHPYYGTCFTFNSGLDKPPLYIEPSTDLAVGLFTEVDEEPDFLVRNPGFAILVHESGTPPILSSALVLQLYPGQWMKLTLTMQKLKRLPAPYPSKCVDKNDLNARRQMVYYSESQKTPYLYSTEGCRTTCMQNRTYETCNCTHVRIPYFPVKDVRFCLKELDGCSQDIEALNLETCDCPLPCEEFIYNSQITYEGQDILAYKYLQDTVSFFFKDMFGDKNNTDDVKWLSARASCVQIIFESAQYENTIEQAKYSVADFWGAIGGNIGFWTGISILALMEVCELFMGCFTDIKAKKQNNDTTIYGQKSKFGQQDVLKNSSPYQRVLNRNPHY